MNELKILIACDEPTTSKLWALCVTELRCLPVIANSIEQAVTILEETTTDLIVVDVTSREVSAIDMCRILRGYSLLPMLVLTPINNESHTLEAYQAGADECIIKPISPVLFLAKVKAWLGRSKPVPAENFEAVRVGPYTLESSSLRLVNSSGGNIKLSNLEFRVLHFLAEHASQTLTSEEIYQQVWGGPSVGSSTLVKNVIYRLRKKIESDPNKPRYIQSDARGYILKL